jgi:hypothetical protein
LSTTISESTDDSSSPEPFGHLARRAFEVERLGDHAHGQDAHFLGHLRHDRRSTGAGAAAHAGGDEDHVRAAQGVGDLLARLLRAVAATSGLAPAPRPVLPSCSTRDAVERFSAWASVFMQMNSTPCTPRLIMCCTALPPAPPTPTTLMMVPS